MPLLVNVKSHLWVLLLLSTNVLTGLFVFLNVSTGDLCRMYANVDHYEDTNPLYHNFELDNSIRNKRIALQSKVMTTKSELSVQKNKKSLLLQRRLRKVLENLGVLLPNSTTASVHANCSVASNLNSCEVARVQTLLNLDANSPVACWSSWNTNITITDKCSQTKQQGPTPTQHRTSKKPQNVFAITPTYARFTQKVDLTSLCQTVMHVESLIWIVVEDSNKKTSLVSNLLERCKVMSVHLNVRTPPSYRPRPGADKYKESYSRGVKQRNLGLSWVREYCSTVKNCSGAVYFMDDDNKYDLRLFEEIKKTKRVSVFPVGFSGGLKVEGPTCDNSGRAISWHTEWAPDREFPIDMAGFAIQVEQILTHRDVWVGFEESGEPTQRGYLETAFLQKFVNRETVECRSNNREVLVWHVKTQKPWILFEANNPTDDQFEV